MSDTTTPMASQVGGMGRHGTTTGGNPSWTDRTSVAGLPGATARTGGRSYRATVPAPPRTRPTDPTRRRGRLGRGLAAALLVAAACSGSDDPSTGPTTTAAGTTAPPPTTTVTEA